MLNELREKYRLKMSRVSSLLKLGEVCEDIQSDYQELLTDTFKRSKSSCGDYTEINAIVSLKKLVLKRDRIIEYISENIIKPWEKASSEGENTSNQVYFENKLKKYLYILVEVVLECCGGKGRRVCYESYIVPEEDLLNPENCKFGGFRQEEVRYPCFLCCGVKNEVLVSTADVIHS